MIAIGSINDPRAAQGFADYLKTQGFSCSLHSDNGQTVVISVAEAELEQIKPLWTDFQQNPHHPRYSDAAWQVGNTRSGLHYGGQQLNLMQRFKAMSLFVQLVPVVCIIIFAGFMFGQFNQLFAHLQFNPSNPLTWFTPALAHFSAIHLIFNLLWWFVLAPKIEQTSGQFTLLTVALLSAAISSWAQFMFVGANFGGLSGVVYALLGYCWIYPLVSKTPRLISNGVVGFMLLWLAFGFTELFFISMANWAHLGGLLTGVVIALVMGSGSKKAA